MSKTAGQWKGTVGVSEHLGSDTFLRVNVKGHEPLTVRADGEVDLYHGDTVYLSPSASKLYRFDAAGLAL